MPTQDLIYLIFFFALGGCIGSFLNVVAYRLPLGMSLVTPGSRCGKCETPIAFYDNIPIVSWFVLRGRCRHCKASFSIRYSMVELFTAVVFAGFYYLYFIADIREVFPPFAQGGFIIYLGHMLMLSVLIAMSLIDLDHMIIDLRACRGAALAAFGLAAFFPYIMQGIELEQYHLLIPFASVKTGSLALGGVAGLMVSHWLIKLKIIRRAYEEYEQAEKKARAQQDEAALKALETMPIHIFTVIGRECLFLTPIVLGAILGYYTLAGDSSLGQWFGQVMGEHLWFRGVLGSFFGYGIGGATVWATRIIGTLGFRKEAMGAGDIDLMATVGAFLGWISPTLAFFLAPFVGLTWAIFRLITHQTREIPYGPFLSMGTAAAMICFDPLYSYFLAAFMNGSTP